MLMSDYIAMRHKDIGHLFCHANMKTLTRNNQNRKRRKLCEVPISLSSHPKSRNAPERGRKTKSITGGRTLDIVGVQKIREHWRIIIPVNTSICINCRRKLLDNIKEPKKFHEITADKIYFNKRNIMANLVCVILILLNVISQGVQGTTPPPLTFDCLHGKIANINQVEDGQDSLLVEYGSSGKLCHITEDTCKPNLKDKETLHVIYDKAEKNKTSQFVAGKLYRYELKCIKGYVAQASATALEIFSTPAQPYIHQDKTLATPDDAITLEILKDKTVLTDEKVHVGDKLYLKITAKAPSALTPIKCTAHTTDSNSKNRNNHLLWNNNDCHASDNAIMTNDWKTINTQSIGIDMFAFRFIDSLSVTIECSAYVCPLGDSNCGQSIKNCIKTPTTTLSTTQTKLSTKVSSTVVKPTPTLKPIRRRRRRNVNQNDRMEKIASTSFTIVDINDNSNGCTGLSSNKLQFFTILLVCICISGRSSSN